MNRELAERQKEAQVKLCVDIYAACVAGTYKEADFAVRIAEVGRYLREWQASDDPRIRLAGVKMAEILRDIRKLAKCTPEGRKWRRIRTSIDRAAEIVERLLKDV